MFKKYYEYRHEIEQYHMIPPLKLKKHFVINKFLNIIIPIILLGICNFNNLPSKILIIIFVVSFIGYDVAGIIIDKFLMHLYDQRFLSDMDAFSEKLKEAPEEDWDTLIQEEVGKETNLSHREKVRYIALACAENVRSEIAKRKIQDAMDEDAGVNVQLDKIKDAFNEFKQSLDICPDFLKDQCEHIIASCQYLIAEAEQEPKIINKIDKTFFIYLPELHDLLNNYDSSEQDKDELSEVVTQMYKHMQLLKDRIKTENKINFQVASSLLLESLQNEEKEGE